MYQQSLGKKIKASIFQITGCFIRRSHLDMYSTKLWCWIWYGRVSRFEFDRNEQMVKAGRRKGTLENHKVTRKMEEGQQELSEWKDFTLIPDGSPGVVCTQTEYVPLPALHSSFYFDGINRTQKEKLLLGLLHFLFQINYA